MINLLPPEKKEKLILKRNKKIITILIIVLLVPLLCLTLILLSISFYILTKVDHQKILLEQNEKQYQTADFLTFKDIIKKYNKNFVQLESFYSKEIYFNQVLKMIANINRPQDIYFTGISLNKDDKGKVTATVKGFSGLRDDLIIFRHNIESNTSIKNPSFSSESWISPENAKFYLSFEIAQ